MSTNQLLLSAILSFAAAVALTATAPGQLKKKTPMPFGDIILFFFVWVITGVIAVLLVINWIAPHL